MNEFFNEHYFENTPVYIKAYISNIDKEDWGYRIEIKDKIKTSKAIVFDQKNILDESLVGKQIEFLGKFSSKYNNFNIIDFRIKELIDSNLYPKVDDNNYSKYLSYIERHIEMINDDNLRKSTNQFIIDNSQKFRINPASVKYHHCLEGGLIQHIAESLQAMTLLLKASLSKGVNSDICRASIVFHDSGKLDSYDINKGNFSITEYEKKIGYHNVGSMMYAKLYLEKFLVDIELQNEILHCIASHHGSTTTGALSEPKTKEAIIVYLCDYYSGMMDSLQYK